MKKFENLLPRYRVMLVKESEDTFTSYPRFQNSLELFQSFREEFAALDREHFFHDHTRFQEQDDRLPHDQYRKPLFLGRAPAGSLQTRHPGELRRRHLPA